MALQSILVLYDGSPRADDIVRLACEDVGGEGRVVALYVTRVPRLWPLDALPARVDDIGNDALDHVERITRRYDGILDTRLVHAWHIADAVVGEALDIAADAIVLPLAPRGVWRRWQQGRVAWEIVRRSSCRVYLCFGPWAGATGAQGVLETAVPAGQDNCPATRRA